ncbi:MAG TPA: hypothetical protein VHE78_12875 [Gemmatimonadaceae bacterium]|nr:hypothetical protein [Gemmatimonadaceae bacterium]
MLVMMSLVALATFLILLKVRPSDSIGRGLLHLYYKSPTMALLPLPSGWRARYGIDRHEQCAILMDAARVPRFMACTFGYGPDNPEYSGERVSAAGRATKAAAPRIRGESVSTDVRQTQSGPIHHVVRTYYSPASFHAVTTGQVVEHEFFRMFGTSLLHLRTYEDAAQRSSLDPIAWELAQGMILVPRP